MASWQKYHCFERDMRNDVHELEGTTDTIKIAISNAAPNAATHETLADVSELATANGYTAGGIDMQNDGTVAAGVLTVTGVFPIVWTASAAGITGRYFIAYNSTATGITNPLIAYLDRGSSTTVPAGQTIAVDQPGDVLFTHS